MADNPLGIVVRLNEHHPIVKQLKRRFGYAEIDDLYDLSMEHRIRGVQMMHSFQTHGQLDDKTLKVLGLDNAGLV
jgi:hypothetical protein